MRARPALDLAWNPLVYVLGQVVTSPVLRIEDYVPELQERFRSNGYPNCDRLETQTVKMGPGGDPDVARDTRWAFYDKDRAHSLVVTSRFLVLETSTYQSFESFIARFQDALELYQDVVNVGLYQRLGFRRVNLFEDSPGLPLDEIVGERLQGLPGDLFAHSHEQRAEHWGNTDIGRLMVRLLRPAPTSVVPSDLETTMLQMRGPTTEGRKTATLDIDHFLVAEHDFVPGEVIERFSWLHESSDLAFRESVTNQALQAWTEGEPN